MQTDQSVSDSVHHYIYAEEMAKVAFAKRKVDSIEMKMELVPAKYIHCLVFIDLDSKNRDIRYPCC